MTSLKVVCFLKPGNIASPVPKCSDCKYQRYENGLSVCKLFKYSNLSLPKCEQTHDYYFDPIVEKFFYYVDTSSCRKNISFCGPTGKYFKEKL
jgi:hypothetical protein